MSAAPPEIKITRIWTTEGGKSVQIEHKKPHRGSVHGHPAVPADPAVVLNAAKAAGWSTGAEPRRKPKHFEVLAQRGEQSTWTELHIDLAGTIYKEKIADREKWSMPD